MTKGNRHDEIILSSMDVFARTNYEKATTALLAKEAGIAEGTLYKYFPSKKELFLECFRFIEGQLIERYEAIYREKEGRPLESLKGVAQSYLDFVRENPSMRKFLAFVLNNSFDKDFMQELKEFMYLNIRATERLLEEAMEKRELKQVDPRVTAWFFVGGYFTLILMTEMEDEAVQDPEFLDKYMNSIYE
ncbi:MAG: TetR/AcrR family transcriptional regulator [Actinomycetota bacterium]|nr:TetR/AcrR family transcriptional regulator [Actinomycetota bacterium]